MSDATCQHSDVYQCAECLEMRCMKCDEPAFREYIKTAVRWCPKHRWAGERGFPQPECNCDAIRSGMGEAKPGHKIGGHEPDCVATNEIMKVIGGARIRQRWWVCPTCREVLDLGQQPPVISREPHCILCSGVCAPCTPDEDPRANVVPR